MSSEKNKRKNKKDYYYDDEDNNVDINMLLENIENLIQQNIIMQNRLMNMTIRISNIEAALGHKLGEQI